MAGSALGAPGPPSPAGGRNPTESGPGFIGYLPRGFGGKKSLPGSGHHQEFGKVTRSAKSPSGEKNPSRVAGDPMPSALRRSSPGHEDGRLPFDLGLS